MKTRFYYFCFLILVVLAGASSILSKNLINRIEGVVYDPNRVPVNDVRVELQNEVGSLLAGTRTASGGRFTFLGVSSGRFIVRVIPVGTNFLEESKDVQIVNLSRNSNNDIAYVDFNLQYNKRTAEALENRPAEVIFVQDIPKEAKGLYNKGTESLKKSPDKGLAEIEQAITIFPNYFDALNTLGKQFISRNDYKKAYPYLIRAIEVNPKSVSAFYSLAYAFYQLNQIPAALEAAKAVTILAPSYADAHLLRGTLLRINKNYKEAEAALLAAKSVSKKDNPEIHWQLALTYNRLNRNQDAIKELETYLSIYPKSPDKKKIQELVEKLRSSK